MAGYGKPIIPQLSGEDSFYDDTDAEIPTTPESHIYEALYLLLIAIAGIVLNILVIALIFAQKELRRMTSAFIIHGCILDLIKCIYCIPFATSLLKNGPPVFCSALGVTYVIIVTASGFNLVAMVCCEAYTFSEHNIGADGRGSLACVVFGLVMVYIGSIIIHLGPTIIGGEFMYNHPIGNCLFLYGTIKSYVVHTMWIVIMTLAITGALYYLLFFYRHVQANSTHRLATLVRASIHISRGDASDYSGSVRKIIQHSLSRARVLFTITIVFVLFWYPLFILTLADPKFNHSVKLYKVFTFLAWSNAAVNPVVYLLFDRSITLLRYCACARRCLYNNQDLEDFMAHDTYVLPGGTRSRRSSISVNHSGGRSRRSSVTGTHSRSRNGSMTRRSRSLSPGLFYERVGSRMCNEAVNTESEHCNGGLHAIRLSVC